MTLYYGVLETVEESSNYVGRSLSTVYAEFNEDKALECKQLCMSLEHRKLWRFVSTAMQLRIKHAKPGFQLRDTVMEAIELCKTLEGQSSDSLRYRAIILKKQISSTIAAIAPPWSAALLQECVASLDGLKHWAFTSWSDYAPSIALDITRVETLQSKEPWSKKIDELKQIAARSESQANYTVANQTYMAARNLAQEWVRARLGSPEGPSALAMLQSLQQSYVQFHKNIGMAYFTAAGLSDYVSTCFVRLHDSKEALQRVQTFQREYPQFGVPITQERLYDLAAMAANSLGQDNECRQLRRKHRGWLMKCPFVQRGTSLTDQALSDPDQAIREIMPFENDMSEQGDSALRLMVRWAIHDWNQKLLQTEDCVTLFGPGLRSHPKPAC